jgi:sirohydrochlorin ferrochelatase
MTGLIVFAHGSRIEEANEAVRRVVEHLRPQLQSTRVEAAFLELGTPGLPEAARRLWSEGIRRITVVPYFLTPGIHLQRDLPRIVDDLQTELQGVSIEVTESLDGHPGLAQAVLERAQSRMKGHHPA